MMKAVQTTWVIVSGVELCTRLDSSGHCVQSEMNRPGAPFDYAQGDWAFFDAERLACTFPRRPWE